MAKTYEELIKHIKQNGNRITGIRQKILRVIVENEHLTLNELGNILKANNKEHINNMTLYNTTNLLIKEGILYTNNFDGKQITYELSSPKLMHLVCHGCDKFIHIKINDGNKNIASENSNENKADNEIGQITEGYIEKINAELLKLKFDPIHYKFEVHGTCKECQKNK